MSELQITSIGESDARNFQKLVRLGNPGDGHEWFADPRSHPIIVEIGEDAAHISFRVIKKTSKSELSEFLKNLS